MNIQPAINEAQKNAINKIRGAFEFAMQSYKGDKEKEIRDYFEEGIDELIDPEPAAKRLMQKEFERLRLFACASHSVDSALLIKQLSKNLEENKKNGNKR